MDGGAEGAGSSLHPGLIVGIVVCALLFLALFIFAFIALYYFIKAKREAAENCQGQIHDLQPTVSSLERNYNHDEPISSVQSESAFQQPQPKYPVYMAVPKPITKGVTANQSQAPIQAYNGNSPKVMTDRAETSSLDCDWSVPPDLSAGEQGRNSLSVLPRMSMQEVMLSTPEPPEQPEPATLPSWEAILTQKYLPPFTKPITKPSPSAPSLNDLDRVPEAPSRAHDNLNNGTLASLDLHSRSLPNLSARSAFQVVRNPQAMSSAENLRSRSQENIPLTILPYTRSASVPVGTVHSELSEYAVPLSVYKVPPPPRHVTDTHTKYFYAYGEIEV